MIKQKFNFTIPGSSLPYSNINSDNPNNLKTLLELSRGIEVDKQKIYRYIKKNNIPHQMINNVMYLDDVTQKLLKREFLTQITSSESISEVHKNLESDTVLMQLETVVKMLQTELESKTQQLNEKDKQIAELSKLVDQQQQLHLVEQKKVLQLEEKEPEKKLGLFKFFK